MTWKLIIIAFIAALFCGPSVSSEFYFIAESMSWDSALSFCRSRYTDLASVADKTQLNRLQRAAAVGNPPGTGTGAAWIGLLDDLDAWSWSGFDDGSDGKTGLEFRNWMSGEPDNRFGTQMCVLMGPDGFWRDEDCLLKKAFVCRGGQSFVYVAQALNWSDARSHCRDKFTDLAWIQNPNQGHVVRSIAAQYGNQGAWIGLHRRRVWSDGTESDFEHWRSGQPDNQGGAQRCTSMDPSDGGRWSDQDCGLELPFVCSGAQETVINLDLQLSSSKPLTGAELTELVSTEFRQLLIELGLSENFDLALKSTTRNETVTATQNESGTASSGEGGYGE